MSGDTKEASSRRIDLSHLWLASAIVGISVGAVLYFAGLPHAS